MAVEAKDVAVKDAQAVHHPAQAKEVRQSAAGTKKVPAGKQQSQGASVAGKDKGQKAIPEKTPKAAASEAAEPAAEQELAAEPADDHPGNIHDGKWQSFWKSLNPGVWVSEVLQQGTGSPSLPAA